MGSFWDAVTSRYRERTALVSDANVLTYGQLEDRTDRAANALLGLGLRAGDRIGILMPNSIEWVIADIASMKAGLVHVRLHTKLTVADFEYLIGFAGCRAIIGTDALIAPLLQERARFPTVDFWVGISDAPHQWDLLLAKASSRPVRADIWPGDECSIRYTAGTTGRPKAAMFSHAARLAGINVYLTEMSWRASDPGGGLGTPRSMLVVSPLTHAGAAYLYWTLAVGGETVLLDRPSFDPELVARTLSERAISHTFLVPTMLYDVIRARPDLMQRSAVELQTLFYGAAPMNPALLGEVRSRLGDVLVQSYGLTEANGVLTWLHKSDHAIAPNSVGRATATTAVAVVDADMKVLPPGEAGEIVGWGPHMMSGYLGQPEATADKLRNGLLRTGDVGVMDERGYLYLKDRLSDMIISGGLNVYPAEVEAALYRIAGVGECAVISRPHDRYGEEVVAVIVPAPGAGLRRDALEADARGKLGGYRRPKAFFVADELPKSQTGKILRREVKRLLGQGSYRPVPE